MGLDAVIAIGSLLLPPLVDFCKKKFLKPSADSPEATMSTLATTSPATLPGYVESMSKWYEANCKYFNRDIAGEPAPWVVNLRAVIRPLGTCGALTILVIMVLASIYGLKPDPSMDETLTGIRYSCEAIVSSWFGDRITIGK